jgi:hypothetical protein
MGKTDKRIVVVLRELSNKKSFSKTDELLIELLLESHGIKARCRNGLLFIDDPEAGKDGICLSQFLKEYYKEVTKKEKMEKVK